ncbi:MAG: hypothetical protein GWO23_25330, partial [Gammaproteobacteria bacterium]|nr:hypothetical protein [Gammaproteobacteria bacterium]
MTPLNRIAELKLKSAGVKVTDNELPIIQLMQWGLAIGIRMTHQRTAAELLKMSLLTEKKKVYEKLVTNIPGGLLTFEKFLLKLSPRSAAEELLELFDMRLKA